MANTEVIKATSFLNTDRTIAASEQFTFIATLAGTLYGTDYCDEFIEGRHTHIFTVYYSE